MLVKRQRSQPKAGADEFIEGIVTPNVFPKGKQIAVQIENGGSVLGPRGLIARLRGG